MNTLETVFDGLILLLRALGANTPPTAEEERGVSEPARTQRAVLLDLWQAAMGNWEPLAIEGAALAWLAGHTGEYLRFPLPGALTRTSVDERIAVLQARGRLPVLPQSEEVLTAADPWTLHGDYSRWRLLAEEALQAFSPLPAPPSALASRLPPALLMHCEAPAPELVLAPPPIEEQEPAAEILPAPPPPPPPSIPEGPRVAWRPEGGGPARRAVLLREEGETVVIFDVITREELPLPRGRVQRLAEEPPAAPASASQGGLGSPQDLLRLVERQVLRFSAR